MKNKTLLLSCLLVVGAFRAEAQFYTWNPAVTNGLWNDTTNWVDGVVPNEAGAVVFFDNVGTVGVGLNGFTATAGEISVANGATFGSTTNTDDILNLDNGDTQPIISANSSSLSAFMYAEVTGTNGFRKTGPGRLSFRFNPNNQNYTGNITLAEGTLGINQDGSLGSADNDIIVEGTSTLQIEPGNNTSPVSLNAGRDISIASGATLTINNTAAPVVTTINGAISGDGNLTFGGTGSLILNGTNTYAGTTVINSPGFGGTATNTNVVTRSNLVSFAGVSSLPASTALTLGFGTNAATNSISTINVNLGGASLNPSILTIGNNTNGASTNSLMAYDISNGSLTYSDAFGALNFSARGTSVVTNELRLPGTTTLSYASMSVGVVGASANAMINSRILIGSNATFNASQFTLAAYRASGSIEARAAGSSLKIRGTDGTSAATNILIGNFSGGPNPVASINMSNGAVDIAATEIVVGKNIANASSATGSLNFGSGSSVTASNLIVGLGGNNGNIVTTFVTNNTNTPPTITTNFTTNQVNLNASVTQNGGSSLINTVILGRSGPTTPTNSVTNTVLDRYTSTYNLNGGTLATSVIKSDSTNAAISGMTRTFNLNGGTLRGLDASSDLTITATTNAFSAIGLVAGTTNSKIITVEPGRSINFSAGVAAQFNGGTTTFGLAADSVANLAGRFQIGVGTANPASVVVTNGTVNLSSASGILGIGDRPAGSSALNVLGGSVNIALAGANRMLVGNKFDGSISVTGGTLTVTGSPEIYVGGDIGFAANNASGAMTVSTGGLIDIQEPGTFALGQNQTNGATTNAIGRLNINQGGTFRTARAILSGTNGLSTGLVNLNGGTLAAGANVVNLLNVTTATVASNSTFDTGTFDSGVGQNLAGTGILTVTGTGTLRLNGTNTPPVVVNNGATLGGTGSSGNVTVNGTLAPGAPDGDGAFTTTGALTVPGTARFRVYGNGINDRLLASGGATLGGTVTVTIGDEEYIPASGDSFDLVEGAITGSPTLDLPALEGGLTWVTNSFTSTGVLSITNGGEPTNNYASWLTNYPSLTGPDALGTADPDGDGFSNNLEYAFDGNPTVGTPALLTVTKSGSDAVFNFVARKNPPGGVTYDVQSTANLASGPWGSAGITPSISTNQSGILIPADYERRQFSVPASGKNFYRVQGTITE
jgi:fibronectin-binding autotransporter adhesin